MFTEMEKFSQKGEIIVSGDYNARTNNALDYVCLSSDFDPLVDDTFPKKRNSEDEKRCCKRGKELLQACKYLDLLILNGRKIGDTFGKITCFRWNGCSVVDYAICTKDFFENCTFFEIGDLMPHLSDHSPIIFHISLDIAYKNI